MFFSYTLGNLAISLYKNCKLFSPNVCSLCFDFVCVCFKNVVKIINHFLLWLLDCILKVFSYSKVLRKRISCFLNTSMASYFTFKYLVHLEYILVYDMRYGYNFSLHMANQLSQQHVLILFPLIRDAILIISNIHALTKSIASVYNSIHFVISYTIQSFSTRVP